jgi:hypothetical protein
MKNLFPGYYRPTEKEFSSLWQDCIFILDTNVILNLYRYSIDTSSELITILEKVSNRLWIPYQAAFEYQKNRLIVIKNQIDAYGELKSIIEDYKNQITSKFNKYLKHPLINANQMLDQINNIFSSIVESIEARQQEHPDLIEEDSLRERITSLFIDTVGSKYDEKRLNEIYEEGLKRYARNIPPGYLDAKNKDGDDKFGDLILWYQIIDKAIETQKSIILITDDTKEDWWWKFKGLTIGPRPELVEEIKIKAKVSFYMYSSDKFMEYAQEYLQEKVIQKAIDEVRKVREQDEGPLKELNVIATEISYITSQRNQLLNAINSYDEAITESGKYINIMLDKMDKTDNLDKREQEVRSLNIAEEERRMLKYKKTNALEQLCELNTREQNLHGLRKLLQENIVKFNS